MINKLNTVKLFVGPMTKNVVDSVINYCNDYNVNIGFIPSRRQIDHNSGYVNNWTTETWSQYVKSKTPFSILERDHGGIEQGEFSDDGFESFEQDVKYLDILHIDPWKMYKDLDLGIIKTVEYIKFCHNKNPNILFEVGTEEAIRRFELHELDKLLIGLKKNLTVEQFNNICYVVVQSGTKLVKNSNTGSFNEDRLHAMVAAVRTMGLKTKDHNCDYLSTDDIKKKYECGLDAMNIAPEFGVIETDTILNIINEKELDILFSICLHSNRWQKWVPSNYNPYLDKKDLIRICGHYMLSNKKVLEITNKYLQIASLVKGKVYIKLSEVLGA